MMTSWQAISANMFDGVVGLQYVGTEVQKAQDVLVSVEVIRKAQRTGNSTNPNVIRILIIGADPIPVDAAQAAMLEKVDAWQTQ